MGAVPPSGRAGTPQYVTLGDVTGQAATSYTFPPGRWQVLTAKVTIITDSTAGARQPALQFIGSDGFEITESQMVSSAGLSPSTTSFTFGAIGGQNLQYTPTYNFSLPNIFVQQDSTGLWAVRFHNSGVVGAGDVWHGTTFYIVQL